MASGHVNRTNRPNTWLHRPPAARVKKVLANPEPSTHGPKRVPLFTNADAGAGVDHDLRIRGILPMMESQEQVDDADAVVRAHQLEFLALGRIAQMDGAEFSQGDMDRPT